MKPILISLLFLMSFQIVLVAQTIELTEQEIETLLCKKWDIEYMEMQGMKITPREGANFTFLFKKGGSFDLLPNNELDPNPVMNWVYSKEDKNIRLYESDSTMGTIIELSENKFVLEFESTEEMPMEGMKGHFKPALEK